jgi:lysozyme
MKIKLVLTLFSLAFSSFSFAAPSFSEYKIHISKYEGIKDRVYVCPAGYKTVGIGSNLEAKGLGGKYRVGQKIDKATIDRFFASDLQEAEKIARKTFPSFDKQPKQVQILLTSLSFNLGQGGITKFKKFRAAIESKNYKVASAELKDSKWFRQTGNRGRDYVRVLGNI